jgi:hypothetical protein
MAAPPLTITRVKTHVADDLFERLRRVRMLKDRDTRPYAEAKLTLGRMGYDLIRPAQRYVLSDNLLKMQQLGWELARHGVDPLALSGYATIWTEGSEEPVDLLPPIVEAIKEADGRVVNIINDGMHRLFAGRLEWREPVVVLVEGPSRPYYAYPIPGDSPWDQVVIVEGGVVPAGLIKKWHRIPDNKRLYRDFNSAFNNVGGPRGQG